MEEGKLSSMLEGIKAGKKKKEKNEDKKKDPKKPEDLRKVRDGRQNSQQTKYYQDHLWC